MNPMTNLTMEPKGAAHAVDQMGSTGRADLGQVPANVNAGVLALARFGLAMLREHRSSFGVGDIDGDAAQEQAMAAGLIEAKTLDAPCGEHCECAGVDDFPLECFVTTEAARAASAWLDGIAKEAPGVQDTAAATRASLGRTNFRRGEVWMSPRGGLWRVTHEELVPGKRLQVVLRQGDASYAGGRKVRRDFDAVDGWAIYRDADGQLTSESAAGVDPT